MVHDHPWRGVSDLLLDETHSLTLIQRIGDVGCSRVFDADVSGGLHFFQGWLDYGPVQSVPVNMPTSFVQEHEVLTLPFPRPFPLLA
jgi:hypothetical protein